MGQQQTLLRHLREHGSITGLEAVKLYNIMRTTNRISELEDRGVKIRRTRHKSKSAEQYPGCVGEYVRYHYKGEE